ncbi:MAG: impB/mucB/samB family protein [Pseudomonadota bacterium]
MNIKECAPEKNGLKWLFLDLNSYFASVEQQENPKLIGKPVAVLPMMTDATCAIAASYEAKAYGIKTGTKVYDAKKLCPQLQCVLARHGKYVEYHHKILEATERCLPINKVWSIDEFDCQLMGKQKDPFHAAELAGRIKESIAHNVGSAVRCSIGIAPNSFLAKVATDIEKPNGLVILRPEELPGRLLDLDLMDLPGINNAMLDRLYRARITTIEALWNTSPKQCRAIWRSVQGERFWYWLHGYDVPYQTTNPSMLGHSRMLDPNMRHAEATRQMARRLLFKACTRLRRKNLYAKRLCFKVRFIEGGGWAGEESFPAAQDPFSLLKHLDRLWERMIDECNIPVNLLSSKRMVFRKVSTLLFGLCEDGTITDDLFEQRLPQEKEQLQKQEKLASALDHLQQKYEKEQVWLGVVPKTLAGHVGTKIAFSRVPDKDEFGY